MKQKNEKKTNKIQLEYMLTMEDITTNKKWVLLQKFGNPRKINVVMLVLSVGFFMVVMFSDRDKTMNRVAFPILFTINIILLIGYYKSVRDKLGLAFEFAVCCLLCLFLFCFVCLYFFWP